MDHALQCFDSLYLLELTLWLWLLKKLEFANVCKHLVFMCVCIYIYIYNTADPLLSKPLFLELGKSVQISEFVRITEAH